MRRSLRIICYSLLGILQMPTALVPYKRILLISYAKHMDAHVIDFCETVRTMKGVKLHILQLQYQDTVLKEYAKKNHIRYICGEKLSAAFGLHYDLVALPERIIGSFPQIRQPKMLYINHGLHIVGRNGGADTYAYTELYGWTHFDVMLEPNRYIAERMLQLRPELSKVIKWVGWKYAESELRECAKQAQCRKLLHLPEGKPIVFVVATWGRNCLFCRLGDGLFPELQRLSEHYLFVLSAHPILYQKQPELGQSIDRQTQYGMRVRQPNEDWIPYLAASDIVLTDYSTLSEAAICAGKKIVFSEFPDDTVWRESRLYRAKAFYPSVRSADELEAALETALAMQDNPYLQSLRAETYVPREAYEENVRTIVRQLLKRRRVD